MAEEEEIALMFAKKKKKKPKKAEEKPEEQPTGEVDTEENSYEDMLSRIYQLMGQERDTTSAKFKLRPPKTEKIGSKKTAWLNFRQSCETLNRTEEHVSQFISAEVGTLCSITQDGALLIRGIFPANRIESCLKKYIELYGKCGMCKSLQTELYKDPNTRLMMMNCGFCKATRSVQPITTGFHATTKADRKKAASD